MVGVPIQGGPIYKQQHKRTQVKFVNKKYVASEHQKNQVDALDADRDKSYFLQCQGGRSRLISKEFSGT